MGCCGSKGGHVSDAEVSISTVQPRVKSLLQVLSPFATNESNQVSAQGQSVSQLAAHSCFLTDKLASRLVPGLSMGASSIGGIAGHANLPQNQTPPSQAPTTIAVSSNSAVKVAVVVRPLLDFELQRGCTDVMEVVQPNRVGWQAPRAVRARHPHPWCSQPPAGRHGAPNNSAMACHQHHARSAHATHART